MDQSAHRLLCFDRFTLDLIRGCLRAGEHEIDLRPKAFKVLLYLAENAGRLVSKEELIAAVWPDVLVTDESLAQCIWVLRDKLGDVDHRLIKTVHRRGYLLDARVKTQQVPWRRDTSLQSDGVKEIVPALLFGARRWKLVGVVTITVLLFVTFAVIFSPNLVAHTQFSLRDALAALQSTRTPIISDTYSGEAARRVTRISAIKQLPLPRFEFDTPAADVPDQVRRYIGIWLTDRGWLGSGRQMMLVVTEVDRDGSAFGYVVLGPPKAKSPVHDPAHAYRIKARISGNAFSYSSTKADFVASLDEKNRMRLRADYRNGLVGEVWLYPVWMPSKAYRTEAAKTPG